MLCQTLHPHLQVGVLLPHTTCIATVSATEQTTLLSLEAIHPPATVHPADGPLGAGRGLCAAKVRSNEVRAHRVLVEDGRE